MTKRIRICLLIGVGLGLVVSVAVAMAGFYRSTSLMTLAIVEAIAGLIVVLYVFLRGGRERLWRRREAHWARVKATVIASDIIETYGWGSGSAKLYAPKVRYTFSLNDVEHEGKHLQMAAGRNTSQSAVQQQMSRYPVGDEVVAYCDPENPARSVLELDDDGSELLMVGLGAIPVFGLATALFAVLDWYGH
jgi:hypothetical protein